MPAIRRYRLRAAVVVVCLLVQALATGTAVAQEGLGDEVSYHDIAVRDELIFDQELLLNAYRCRFRVDTQVVGGGCTNGLPARDAPDPNVFEGIPTQREVIVRDALIFAQELLLNAYRCRFDIDTQVVPVGCAELLGNTIWVNVSSESERFIGISGSFEVNVEFARPVGGFAADRINVVNGEVTGFSGSDTQFRAVVRPSAPGTVVFLIPSGAAHDTGGNRSAASVPLIRTATSGAAPTPVGIDTWDRETVLAAYAAEFTREEPESGFFGDVFACVAGTTSQQFRDSVIQRVNWYRQMAGLHPVSENREFSTAAQQAALLMAAQERISHYPESDWACYTQTGEEAARSNLSLGAHGIEAIDNYMQDDGDNNLRVGHRRWILYARLTVIGTGDIPPGANRATNALYVFGQPRASTRQVREERGFVAWPSPGYVPAEVNWGRWSFVLPNADFSGASVEVRDEYGPVEVQIIDRDRFIETGIVWAMHGELDSSLLPSPSAADHCSAVTISGVEVDGVVQTPFEYAVCVLGR